MHLEHFDPTLMQDALESSKTSPDQLKNACFAYGQHRRFLTTDTRTALDQALLKSPHRSSSETAIIWVDALYECLGTTGRSALESYEIEPSAPNDAREHCGRHVAALKQEELLPLDPSDQSSKPWLRFKDKPLIDPAAMALDVSQSTASLPEQVMNHGLAPIAAPDCDGTLWYGDSGDLFFERALSERWLLPACAAPLNSLCDRYGITVHSNVNDTARSMMESRVDGEFLNKALSLGVEKNEAYRQFYGTQALCMAGMDIGFIKARTFEIMDEPGGLKHQIFPEIQTLLKALGQAGLVVVPISASLNLLVEVGVTFLGIPGRRALGVTTPHSEGLLLPKLIEPMPYGPGKITLISQLGGQPPAVALGDSWQRTDKELLEGAGLGLVITHGEPPENLTPSLICLDTKIPEA
mgnify:CR=1 FL=1